MKWFRMEASKKNPAIADIYIFGFIGDWVDDLLGWDDVTTAKSFIDELEALPDSVKTIRLHVNSPGGDVFGAVAITNALRDQRTTKGRQVETIVEGLAASAASIVIQAGNPIRMADNALIMIHNPTMITYGEESDHRRAADALKTIRLTLISTYQWHSKLSAEKIGALMDEATWLEVDEAIEKGFATEKVEGLKVAASIDPRGLAKLSIPEKYRDRVKTFSAPKQTPQTAVTPRIDFKEVYRQRNEAPPPAGEEHPSVPPRPRSFTSLASAYYGQRGDAGELIGSSQRGGAA